MLSSYLALSSYVKQNLINTDGIGVILHRISHCHLKDWGQ
jgi:hypothetical protein